MPLAPPRVYAIADHRALGERNIPEAVEEIASAGVRWIQIRDKRSNDAERYDTVEAACRRLEGSKSQLWINDRVDLATLFPVFGVHLGQEDLSPVDARALLAPTCSIGLSTHSMTQIECANDDPAVDLIAVGPVFHTKSKVGADGPVGLDLLRHARQATDKTLVAIGGITEETIESVLEAGADTVAVLGALCRSRDLGNSCRRLLVAAMEAT